MDLSLNLALGISGSMPWYLPYVDQYGAVAAWNFVDNQTYNASQTFTRFSTGLMANSAGVYSSFATNELRRISGYGALAPEPARTNNCTNYNANPTDTTNLLKTGAAAATLAVVDDTAALLEAAGLSNICSSEKLFRFYNPIDSGGNAFCNYTSTIAGEATFSVWVGGTGIAKITGAGASGGYAALSSALEFRSGTGAGDNGQIGIYPGTECFFILNQAEEGATGTSPIVTAGSSAARDDDALTLAARNAGTYDFHILFDDDSEQIETSITDALSVPTTYGNKVMTYAYAVSA